MPSTLEVRLIARKRLLTVRRYHCARWTWNEKRPRLIWPIGKRRLCPTQSSWRSPRLKLGDSQAAHNALAHVCA